MKYNVPFLILFLFTCTIAAAQSKTAADSVAKTKPAAVKSGAPVADTTTAKKKKEPKPPYVHQFRIGFDVSRIAANIMFPSHQSYEVQADYLLPKNTYVVAEVGFGKGKIDYENLRYDNTGYYFKVGFDKSFLDIVSSKDFDIGFIGLHYGAGPGQRTEATYTTQNIFGSPTTGKIPAQNYFAHWGEITGGIKVEVFKNFFVGWNLRMRFLLNPGVFSELSPSFIPGYGKGDKSTAFDINFYTSYAIRWGGK